MNTGKSNLEIRGTCSGIEVRQDGEQGIFEGYACLWGQVDDWNSTFDPGAFTRTLQERGSKLKVLYQHDPKEPIGKPIEVREDEKGLFVRGQLSLGVENAREAFELMKDKVIDTLSFGFSTISDYYKGGVRHIREAKLMEFSPVTFAANENAIITSVRSTNFKETLNQDNLSHMGRDLFQALYRTIEDVWWESKDNKALMSGVNKAIDQFKANFMSYAQSYVDTFMQEEKRAFFGGELALELRKYCDEKGYTIEEYSKHSIFSIDELNDLLDGKTSMSVDKLTKLPENIRAAYQREKNSQMERFCTSLRESNSMTEADMTRLGSLLGLATSTSASVQSAIGSIAAYRKKLAGL